MHGARNGHSHLKRQDLVPPVVSGILGNSLPVSSAPLSFITNVFPSDSSSSTTSTRTSSHSSSSERSSATSITPTASPSVYETTSGGSVHTVTTSVNAVPSSTESVAPPVHKAFLQNKALSGVVFAFAGLAGLIIIFTLVTFTLRRRRNNRLLKEAISFDPVSMNSSSHHHHGTEMARGSMEKRSMSTDNCHEPAMFPRNQEQSPELRMEYGYGAKYPPSGPDRHPIPQVARARSAQVKLGPVLHSGS